MSSRCIHVVAYLSFLNREEGGEEIREEPGGRDEEVKWGDNQGVLEESSKCWFSEHIFHRMKKTPETLCLLEHDSHGKR